MRTAAQIISSLNEGQRQLLADTINHGGWGNCDTYFKGEYAYAYGYITDQAHLGGHFERRPLSNRFRSLFKALGLNGDKKSKDSAEMQWIYDWWEDGTGSVLFIRDCLVRDFEDWAKNYE